MKTLDGQVALVTGASRGIGKAILQTLGAAGATVIGTATTEQGAGAIGAALKEAGLSGDGKCLDVRNGSAIDALVQDVTAQYGSISILVNNAGITRDNLLMRMKDDEWNDVLETDLTSVFRLSRAVMKGMMKARQGRIINISSVVGFMGNLGQSNYVAAKAGLTGFTKALAREIGSRQITVNCVAPGFIETDMTNDLSEDQKTKMLSAIPLARLGHPDDVAKAVLYLASPAAAYVTGTTIHVNGGMHME